MNETGRKVEEFGFTSLGELILDIIHRSPGCVASSLCLPSRSYDLWLSVSFVGILLACRGNPSAAFFVQELTTIIPEMSDVAGTTERVAFHAQAQSLADTLRRRFGHTHPHTFNFEDAGKLTADSGKTAYIAGCYIPSAHHTPCCQDACCAAGIETVKALRSQGILVVEGDLTEALDAGTDFPDNGTR